MAKKMGLAEMLREMQREQRKEETNLGFNQPTCFVAPGQTYPISQAKILASGKREDFPEGGYRVTFPDLESFYAEAVRAADRRVGGSHDDDGDRWNGGVDFRDLGDYVRDGWKDKAAEVQRITDRALTTADVIAEEIRPILRFDVQGEECDMGRYYGGEPENMLDWPLTPVPGEGRVITLISSLCFSAGIDSDVIVKRGCAVAGLAEALTAMGYSVGIVVDISSGERNGGGSLQITLKNPTDDLNMPRVIFGLAHPSMLRMIAFRIWEASAVRDKVQNFGLGPVNAPYADKADGQLLIPGIDLREDNYWDDAERFIRETFTRLGLISE